MSKARSPRKKQSPRDNSLFVTQSAAVVEQLQARLGDVLKALGNVTKSGDLERLLYLDRTLAWQLIKVAEAEIPLESAASVPSRVSMNRLVQGALALGVSDSLTRALLSAYDEFESLVERHAGDRVCFNSMVTAAVGGDG
ncbi:MAG TPA: hypothetical protein VM452_20785, partial [Caulifigura sp.]|nr:hypothetical protein [Caulifigura sp.]